MRLFKFGQVELPPAEADQNMPVSARSSLIQLENGSIDQDGDRTVLGTNRITHRAKIVDTTVLETDSPLFNLMRELGRGRNILYAILRDGTQLVTWAKLLNMGRSANVDKYDAEQPVNITFEQDFPYWMHGDDGWYLDQGYTLDSGMFLDGNYYQQVITVIPHDFGIDNVGTARNPAGTISIVPRAGASITNPRLTNLTNNLAFQYTGTVGAEQRLVVDLLTKTVTLDGSSAYSSFSVSGERQVEYMALELGVNSLRLTGSAISGTVDLYYQYKRLYL